MTGRMNRLDLTLPTPEENVALDEALLDQAEQDGGPEILRFWESPVPFVVLGAGSRSSDDVLIEQCRADGIPVLRRCSGGGTVVQGPGCLNYALVLDKARDPQLQSIAGTNDHVLSVMCACLSAIRLGVDFNGTSDLCFAERKFSGNAQRRKRGFILFHGTLLYDFPLELIARYLAHPPKQPDYRAQRPHGEFVTNFPADPIRLRDVIAAAWGALTLAHDWPCHRVDELVGEKYASADWNLWR